MTQDRYDNQPEGWYVLSCEGCLASVVFDREAAETYADDDWQDVLTSLVNLMDHDAERHVEHEVERGRRAQAGQPGP